MALKNLIRNKIWSNKLLTELELINKRLKEVELSEKELQRDKLLSKKSEIEKQLVIKYKNKILVRIKRHTILGVENRDLFYPTSSEFINKQMVDPCIYKKTKEYIFYIFRNNLYSFDSSDRHSNKERQLMIKEHYLKYEKKFRRLQKEIELFESIESTMVQKLREPIPEAVRFAVWRRDKGKCVICGSNKNLEFDHIIPISEGGSNTERNVQLLCEKCNREKSNKI